MMPQGPAISRPVADVRYVIEQEATMKRTTIVLVVLACVGGACGDASDGASPTTSAFTTTTEATTTTASTTSTSTSTTMPPSTDEEEARRVVEGFLTARVFGAGAEDFMTPDAVAGYAQDPDLDLYGPYLGYWISSVAADAGSSVADVLLEVPDGLVREDLALGAGTNVVGAELRYVVRSAVAAGFEAWSTTGTDLTVGDVVAIVQNDLDAAFLATENPPPGVLGAFKVVCAAVGPDPVTPGSVLSCVGLPRTDESLTLDSAGMLMAVLDGIPTIAWAAGTDLPTSQDVLDDWFAAADGLSCAALMDPETAGHPFGGAGSSPEHAYFGTLVYWYLAGQPADMDADGNGRPCEEYHDEGATASVMNGGEVR